MNYKLLLKFFYFLSLIVFKSLSCSFPWQTTFSGINTQQAAETINNSPFQTPSTNNSNSNHPQSTNPFLPQTKYISQKTTEQTSLAISQILSNQNAPLSQKANAAFTTSTSIGGASLKITPKTKFRTTPVANALGNLMNISFTQLQKKINQPSFNLFPENPELTTTYKNFMNALEKTPNFLPLFKKLHITALHQIYIYLTGIYTSLNMTHIDDVKSYMITEKKYALNKKTLIINHILSLVMAQLNQALQAVMPGIREH